MKKFDDFMGDFNKKKPNPEKLSRHTVKYDRYDRNDFERLLKEMEDLDVYREKLASTKAGELGRDIAQDMYLNFWKVSPRPLPASEVRPSHQINRVIEEEARGLKEMQHLRQFSQGDDIASALAFVSIEPDLETLYDRLDEQIKQAQELDQIMQQIASLERQQRDVEEMFNDWSKEDEEEREPIDWNARMQGLQEQIDGLSEEMEGVGKALQEALEGQRGNIRATMRGTLGEAADKVEGQEDMAEMWGLESGQLHRLPAEQRMELARKMNNPKLRKIAERFGPMKRLAFTEQRRKVNYAPEEIFDVEKGNNLARLLPSEMLKLADEDQEYLFFKDYFEKNLQQYQMRGYEKVGKGGIIFCHDGSGSMSGEPEIWAKAVGLALLHIARKQKRAFIAIQFSSPGQIHIEDFSDSQNIDPEKVMDFAEYFYGGGTDFVTPLNKALEFMNAEHDKTGALKSDVVFATDGMCGVPEPWLEAFEKERERLGFTVWGIAIGCRSDDEPLATICNKRVATIKSLTSGEDIRDIFGGV